MQLLKHKTPDDTTLGLELPDEHVPDGLDPVLLPGPKTREGVGGVVQLKVLDVRRDKPAGPWRLELHSELERETHGELDGLA